MDWLRLIVGVLARGVTWAGVLFIAGNAVAGSIGAGDWVGAVFEAGFFPLTFFLHPFMAAPDAIAWPFPDGTSFLPALIAALVAYPVSTFVGGLGPID